MNNGNNATLVSDASRPLVAHWPMPAQSGVVSDRPTIKEQLDAMTGELMASLPCAEQLTAAGRRGIIARYSAVLEGNFIYWMTGAYLAAKSEEAREIILDNLREEVRDCHPGMMRRFAMAAGAMPTDADAGVVYPNMAKVRLFIGRFQAVPVIATMAFFEGFIQQFMAYLADLAQRQGSQEMEYTDVHGVCDIAHSQELYRALAAEMAMAGETRESPEHLFEGVYLLRNLIQSIVFSPASTVA